MREGIKSSFEDFVETYEDGVYTITCSHTIKFNEHELSFKFVAIYNPYEYGNCVTTHYEPLTSERLLFVKGIKYISQGTLNILGKVTEKVQLPLSIKHHATIEFLVVQGKKNGEDCFLIIENRLNDEELRRKFGYATE